jgi:hypothetical protein
MDSKVYQSLLHECLEHEKQKQRKPEEPFRASLALEFQKQRRQLKQPDVFSE